MLAGTKFWVCALEGAPETIVLEDLQVPSIILLVMARNLVLFQYPLLEPKLERTAIRLVLDGIM